MKETIQRLQLLADRAKKYYWKDESEVVVKLSDVRAVLEFYKSTIKESGLTEDEFNNGGYTDSELNCKSGCMGPCGQCKDEPPNAPDITPEWDKIPERFKWVCIDRDGEEIAHQYEPGVNGLGFWMQKSPFLHGEERKTGRFFDMTNIDWTKTLSKRPAK